MGRAARTGRKQPTHFISGEKYEQLQTTLRTHAQNMREEVQKQLDAQVGTQGSNGISREGFYAYYAVLPAALDRTAEKVRGTNNPERLNRINVVNFAKESAREAWDEAKPALLKHGFDNNDIVNAAAADATALGRMCQDIFNSVARGNTSIAR